MTAYISLYDQARQEFCDTVRKDQIKDGDARGEKQLQEFLQSRESATAAKESATDLQKDVSSKYSSKKLRGKEIISETWIANVMGNISHVIEVGNFLFAGSPESVGMAWFCVKLGLNAIKSNYDLYSVFGSGLTTVTEIMILIPHYDKLFHSRKTLQSEISDLEDQLFRFIVGAYTAVLDFCFSIKRHVEPSKLKQIAHAVDLFGASLSKFQDKQNKIFTLKANVLEAADGVFKGRMTDDMREVQSSLNKALASIHEFAGVSNQLAEKQDEMLKLMQEMKATFKPKTRWDILKQDFDKIRRLLDPMRDDSGYLDLLRKERQLGTAEIVLNAQPLIDWRNTTQGSLLCVVGHAGSGKSVSIVSATDHINASSDEASTIFCYLSCAEGSSGRVDLGNDPVTRVTSTLIFQVYRLAVEDESQPDILEECNKVFRNPKSAQIKMGNEPKRPSGNSPEQIVPDFSEAVTQLARNLRRNVFMVIDAIDELSNEAQNSLYDVLNTLISGKSQSGDLCQSIRILAGCRSNTPFSSRCSVNSQTLDVEGCHVEDMKTTLQAQLAKLADWSNAEREEAVKEVLKKAGPRFDYITGVAIPFLQQPFQRPLSNRLKFLPEGITDSYKQALRGMAPNYFALLRTALIWTLHSAQPVRVKEVMESFSNIYMIDAEQLNSYDDQRDTGSYKASDLELQQIQQAGGPFLKFWKNRAAEDIVEPVDTDLIRSFCQGTDEPAKGTNDLEKVLCDVCKTDIVKSDDLILTQRNIHLDLAILLLRNLNSPLYQIRFGLLPEEESSDSADSETADTNSDQSKESTDGTENVSSQDQEESATGDESSKGDDGPGLVNDSTEANDESSETENTEKLDEEEEEESPNIVVPVQEDDAASVTEPEEHDSGSDSDDSLEDEDHEEVVIKTSDDVAQLPVDEPTADGSEKLRYEINYWHHHVREADDLFDAAEKASDPKWAELIALLDKFAIDNKSVFNEWMDQTISEVLSEEEENPSPLHVAAYFGLTAWAEHLIKDRAFSPSDSTGGLIPLQAAALNADSRWMLKLLLNASKVEAESDEALQQSLSYALQEWLSNDSSAESIQIFVDYGVDFNLPGKTNEATALHCFAEEANDPAAFNIIMEQDDTKRPDINALNSIKETPLHRLLWRRNTPTDLLRAFIDNGANIDVDDEYSIRPLQCTCRWAEPDLARVLLEYGIDDIDDRDNFGQTALHSAALAGSQECVKLLAEKKADLNCKDKFGRRPLHLAAWEGRLETAQTLINLGVEMNVTDGHNRTPFWFACYSKSPETAEGLLNALRAEHSVSEINKPSRTQRTPLRLAATHGFSNVVQELIDMTIAADLNVKEMLDMQDQILQATALHRASSRGELQCVKLLLQANADPALRDRDRRTPLQLASEQWQKFGSSLFEDIVLCLVNADPQAAKDDKELAATAAVHGSVRVLEKLFQIGADLSKADSYGWTPLSMAQRLGKLEAERFLKRQISWGGSLPDRWVKYSAIEKHVQISDDGAEILHSSGERVCISTNRPLPAGLERFYFEINSREIADNDDQLDFAEMAIGFCSLGAESYNFPGWLPKRNAPFGKSWAYHGDDGGLYAGSNHSIDVAEKYGWGDTVGCGVDLVNQKIWFTKNGKMLKPCHANVSGRLFPVIGLHDAVSLQTNFGGSKPFEWKEANEFENDVQAGAAEA